MIMGRSPPYKLIQTNMVANVNQLRGFIGSGYPVLKLIIFAITILTVIGSKNR